jgi:SET domain-containing protein
MSLCEDVKVRRSPIHGKGVFSRRDFEVDELIGVYEGRPSEVDGTYVLWVETDDDRLLGVDGTNELRFLNHSCRPNAEFDGTALYALRAIVAGEEITFHYGEEWEEEEESGEEPDADDEGAQGAAPTDGDRLPNRPAP